MSARDTLARIRARYEDTHMPPRGRGVGAFSMLQPEFEAFVEGYGAVLEIHKPEWTSDHHGSGYYRCSADHWTLDDQTPACPTVQAIETALEGR